jgi:hypothetical protein
LIAHNPHHPAPLLFSAACAAADAMSPSANGRRVRPCFVWSGQTYYKCRDCNRWRPKSNFSSVFNPKSACGIQSYCKPCHSRRTYAAQLRREGAANYTSRKPKPRKALDSGRVDKLTPPCVITTAILPKVVNPTVMVASSYAADTTEAFERGRFDKARAYNPALTWEGWITVAGKKRGRPPRRDSGAVKGVEL